LIRTYHRALECQAGKQSLGSRVAQNLCIGLPIGAGRSMATHRATGCRSFAADLEFVGEQVVHALLVHDHQHQVNPFGAELRAPASAGHGKERGSTPAISSTAGSNTLAVLGAENEAAFYQVGDNGDALGAIDHLFRDALVGRIHDFGENLAGCLQTLSRVCLVGSSPRGNREYSHDYWE